jgi:hypothetical protein
MALWCFAIHGFVSAPALARSQPKHRFGSSAARTFADRLYPVGAKSGRSLVQSCPQHRFFKRVAQLHRPHFDVALRELVFELQAGAQRIDKAPMPRFRPSIDLEDKVLMLQTLRGNTVFHGTLHGRPEH